MTTKTDLDTGGLFNTEKIIQEATRLDARRRGEDCPDDRPDREFARRLVAGFALINSMNGMGERDD